MTASLYSEFENVCRRQRNADPENYELFLKFFRAIYEQESYGTVFADANAVLINQGQARMVLKLLKHLENGLKDPPTTAPAPQ